MTWLLVLVAALGCASQDQQQQPSQRETVGSVSQAVVTTCGSSAVPATTTWVQPGYTLWQNHDSFMVPVGSAPTDNLDIEFTEPSGITGVYVNWLCVRAYLRSTTGNVTYLGTSTVTAGTHTCAAGTCLRRVSYDMSAVTPGTYEVLLAADDQNTTFLRRTIDVLGATFPPVQYRQVTYARDIDEYFAFPTLTPPATPLFSPELRRPNHFIFNVPTRRAVTLQVDVGNSAAALDLVVTDSRRTVIKSTAVPSVVTGHQLTAVSLGTLNPGNYELDLAPRNEVQTYKVSSGDAAIPVALKDGADLAQAGTSLYFFVPAEAETVFLLGAFDSASAARFFSPGANGPEVTPVSIGSGVYALDTRGQPGIWRTTYQTTTARAHFINLPEIYSFDANAAIASTRIRTAMNFGPVLASPLELPYLRPDNHFVFHVPTAASPSFNIAVEDISLPTARLAVKLLDSNGANLWTGSLPVGAVNPVSAGLLQPGDYELHVKNPNGTTRYLITAPAGVTFAAVDDVRVGNVWLARYREYFYVSPTTPSVTFFADGSTATFTIYRPDGTSVSGQPTPLGHNMYSIPTPTPGAWGMNVGGATNIRFLNVPQIIGWDPTFRATPVPGGIIQCTTDADCATGQVCGTDNGGQFGLAATADVCWLPTCDTAPPPAFCGTQLSPCGTCLPVHCSNGVLDQDESGVDCGGACVQCPGACLGDNACPTNNPECTSDADCPGGMICPVELNGWRFGQPGKRICERPDCCSQASEIGTTTPECGLCVCKPDCSTKQCGDADMDDGCHGRCVAVCDPGETGCQQDSDCTAGNICRAGKCVEGALCARPDLAPPNCGPGSACGPCPPPPVVTCDDRLCGVDPVSGADCGSCGAQQFCNAAGRCTEGDHTPPIEVPTPTGTRPVVPDDAPDPPALIGATPGVFAVTDRGSSSYSIPLEVPPGRAGIEPSLAVRYTSSTANGALGVGWSIDGFSSIARCAHTYAQDGFARAIKGDTDDAFCLDGQRLVLVGPNEYRTQIESFSKVVAVGNTPTGPQSFKVYGKDGRVRYYGSTSNARNILRGSVVASWALNREEDRVGNYLRIAYEQTTTERTASREMATAEMVPRAISYTGFGALDGDREVLFNYDTARGDTITGYRVGGGAFARSRILRSIDVRASNALVRRYVLTYEESANQAQRLTSIQECVGQTAAFCHKPTQFTYYDESGFDEGQDRIIPNEEGRSLPPAIFANGIVHKSSDGRDLLSVLTTYSTPYYTTPIPLGASTAVSLVPAYGPIAAGVINLINLMGLQEHHDLLVESYEFDMVASQTLVGKFACGGDLAPLRQVFGNGNFGAESIRETCPTSRLRGNSNAYYAELVPAREWLVDLDADGVQDLVYCAEDPVAAFNFGPMHLDYKLARAATTGNSEPPAATTHAQRDGEVALYGTVCDLTTRQQFSTVIDVDNDGSGNLLAYDSELGWSALVPSGSGYAWSSDAVTGLDIEANYHYYVTAIDANGDGLRDILALPSKDAFPQESGTARIPIIAFNNGHGFTETILAPYKDGTILAGGSSPIYGAYVLDIDQDGIEELVFADPDDPGQFPTPGIARPWRVARVKDNWKFVNEAIPSLVEGPGVLGDFDGDGDIDAFTQAVTWGIIDGRVQSTPQPFRFHSGKGRKQNLLLSVTDGAGHQTKINYNDANELGPVYKKFLPSGDCRWPQRCVARTDHALVSDHTDAHFESQSRLVAQVDRVTSYQYEGARLDTAGYGWLGFGRRTILIEDGAQDFLGSTTIDYEDPEPWVLGTSTAPYKYLRAGLQHSRREVAPSAYSPISSSTNHHAETFRTFEYTERTSVSGRPFIFLSRTEVNTSDLLSDTNDAVQLVQEVGTTDLDAYGNATDETTTRTDYAYSLGIASLVPSSAAVDHRSSTFTPTAAEVASWLISLPKTVTISSTPRCISSSDCAARTQERTTSITYYPDTGLSQVVTRDSTDPSLSLTTEVIRDDRGNVTQVTSTDVNGDTRIGRTTFDTRHLFPVTTAAVADASEHVTQVRFDDRFGSLASMADPNGIDETWSYDEFGVMRAHSGPGGSETTDYQESDYQELADGFEIPASLKVTTNKLGGARLETEINSFGQVVRRKSFGFNGENVFEELGYDSRQRLTIQRRPHLAGDASQGQVQYGYDELDRLITEDYPDGAHVAHDYASAASLVTSLSGWRIGGAQTFVQATDPRGNKTLSIYDRDNQLIGVVDAKNDLTSYEYAAFGQLERIVDPFERMIDFVHDPYGRLRSVTDDARGGTESTSYNAFDQPVFTSDAAGRVRQMHYDGFGRIESLDDNDGTSTWVYDRSDENENDTHDNEIGRPVEVTSSSGQRQILHYEPRQANSNRGLLDQSTSELYPLDAPVGAAPRRLTTHYHYDGYSRLEQIDYPTSSGVPLSVKYSFDGYGHTLSAFNAENTSQVYWRLISADQGYRIKEERLGTHTCGTSQGTATTRTYEALSGRQHTIKTQCGSQLLQDLTYAYDPSGNLSSRVDARTDLTENFDHDELNRLTGYSTGEGVPVASRYSYESNSLEQRRMTWQADVGEYVYETAKGRDWIYSAGQTIYEHDAVGNIISRTRQDVAGDSQSIEYTAFDLPSKVTAPGTEVDFAYDASGSRVVKQGPSSTTFYGGDGYQRTETGAAINQRFTIYAGGRAIAQISNTDTGGTVSPATVNYLHDDHLGSVNVISDAAGALTTTRTYTPFGKDSSPPTVSPFGFTGQEADDDLGLINMRGRMYDPTLGQFLSADPIMQQPYGQGLNRFAYVNNSPLNFTDPSGFAAKRTSKAYGGDGQTEGILAGFGMYFVAGISSQLGAGAQAFSVGAAAGAVAPAAEVAGGSAATEAGVEAGAAYGPGAGVASIASVGVSIAIDDMLGTWQPTGASSAEPARSGGGRTGGAVGRGAAAPDALAPVQERGGRPSLFDRARGALAANDSDSDSAVKNPFLKFEHKLDSSFKPVGPVELGDFSPGKAPDMGSPPRRTLDPPGPDEVTSVWDHNIKQKYLDELSKLDPSPGKYLLEQNKPLLKAQGSRLLSQINENPINWVPIALVGGGLATIGVVAAVNCGRDGVDCSFK